MRQVTAVAGFCVLASLGLGGCTAAPQAEPAAPSVSIEPVLFVGTVEVTGDRERGFGVLLSTATEEVIVADSEVGRRLADYEGEVVAAYGRLLESPNAPSTMVVREFHVLGDESLDRSAAQRVSALGG
jgi:hypothetical protein